MPKPIFLIELPEAYRISCEAVREAMLNYTNHEYHVVIAIYNTPEIKFSVLNERDSEPLTDERIQALKGFVTEVDEATSEIYESSINKNEKP